MDPEKTGAGHIDLDKVLLPKKEGAPSTLSAERVNAATLLEQEQSATLVPPAAPQKSVLEEQAQPAPAVLAVPTPEPKASTSGTVRPLQTYQSDIESVIQDTNASVVSIATAEAQRRSQMPIGVADPTPAAQTRAPFITRNQIIMIAAGLLLIAGAGGLFLLVYSKMQPVTPAQAPTAPFISVDETQVVTIPEPQLSKSLLMQELEKAREAVRLSVGLIERVKITVATSSSQATEISGPAFLQTLSPRIPDELLRNTAPTFLFGIHSFDSNQAFAIFHVDSYEVSYAAMLNWEFSMADDLSPVFTRTPSPHLGGGDASTTLAATSTGPIVRTNFVDRIVENHDARVIENSQGDILLLWTFLDKSTLVITTNEYTLRELISRRNTTSLVSQP